MVEPIFDFKRCNINFSKISENQLKFINSSFWEMALRAGGEADIFFYQKIKFLHSFEIDYIWLRDSRE